jgi:hypothetical protein
MADKDDDLYDAVNSMADRLKLTGSDRTKYVHDHMTRGGYKAVPQYVPRDDKDDDEGDDDTPFFSRRRRSRPAQSSASRRRRDEDDDDWYSG